MTEYQFYQLTKWIKTALIISILCFASVCFAILGSPLASVFDISCAIVVFVIGVLT